MPEPNVDISKALWVDVDEELSNPELTSEQLEHLYQLDRYIEELENTIVDQLVRGMIDYDINNGIIVPIQLPMNYVVVIDEEYW